MLKASICFIFLNVITVLSLVGQNRSNDKYYEPVLLEPNTANAGLFLGIPIKDSAAQVGLRLDYVLLDNVSVGGGFNLLLGSDSLSSEIEIGIKYLFPVADIFGIYLRGGPRYRSWATNSDIERNVVLFGTIGTSRNIKFITVFSEVSFTTDWQNVMINFGALVNFEL